MNTCKISPTDYCCFLTGHGRFHDTQSTLDFQEESVPHPHWISTQGELRVTGLEWDILIGIAHRDEEWRQKGDLKEFLLIGFEYLETLLGHGYGGFTIWMSYSEPEIRSFELSRGTIGLLSALNIQLEVLMNPMTISRSDRIAGLLYGTLVADSLALGAHWIYDQEKLARDFGRVTELLAPRSDSYHQSKKRGQQTHYGDQSMALMDSISKRDEFEVEGFAQDWESLWDGYSDYFDHATKETLQQRKAGLSTTLAASTSEELGGAARIGPLLAALASGPEDVAIAAARAQTAVTHNSKIAGDAAEFLTRIVFALLRGSELKDAIEEAGSAVYAELNFAEMKRRVKLTSGLSTADAAKELGLACPAPQALPTLLMLLDRYGDNFETAVIENVMAGGDNAARALAVGLILGAAHGKSGIPARWIEGLEAAPRVEAFLAGLNPFTNGVPGPM